MDRIIVATTDELESIFRKVIKEYFHPKPTEQRELITLDEAVVLLKENGFPTAKGTIYKLTSADKIPYKKYGNKLMFSRKELLTWMQSQVVNVTDTSDVAITLAKDVRKRGIHNKG